MSNPLTAGPNGDGSKSLTKESKTGLFIQWLLGVLAVGGLGWLTNLDTSHWSGFAGAAGALTVTWAIGILTAWNKRNR